MSPQLEVLRVKPVELRAPNFRLSKGLIDLTKGFSLTGFEGIGGVWKTPPYIAARHVRHPLRAMVRAEVMPVLQSEGQDAER